MAGNLPFLPQRFKVILDTRKIWETSSKVSSSGKLSKDRFCFSLIFSDIVCIIKDILEVCKWIFDQKASFVKKKPPGYFSSTLAPAASNFFLASSAASFLAPFKTSFGADSTNFLASIKPKV